MNIRGHFRTINRHKLMVMKYCFRVGLFRQGLLHDLSKYSPSEFIPGCIYYQGNKSPNNAQREAQGYSSAWLHHKGRNKHHYEYWIDYGLGRDVGIVGQRMPGRYVVEMFLDRVAASRVYNGKDYRDSDPLEYYLAGAKMLGNMIHPETAELLERLLRMLADQGEKKTLAYLRKNIRKYQNIRKKRICLDNHHAL